MGSKKPRKRRAGDAKRVEEDRALQTLIIPAAVEAGDVEMVESLDRPMPANYKGYSEVFTSTLCMSGNGRERVDDGNEADRNIYPIATPESFLKSYDVVIRSAVKVVRVCSEVEDIKISKVVTGFI